MKQYLKMVDYFVEGGVSAGDIRIVDGGKHTIIYSCEDAAAHAINSHDELVEINKELLDALKGAVGLLSHYGRTYGHSMTDYSEFESAVATIAKFKGVSV